MANFLWWYFVIGLVAAGLATSLRIMSKMRPRAEDACWIFAWPVGFALVALVLIYPGKYEHLFENE